MNLPDLESLRCVVAAAEAPSFRQAASRIGLSPAAFSERIKRFEDQLGVDLFDRGPRHLELTAAGRRLLGPARAALDAARACLDSVRDDAEPMPVRIRLGTRFELGLSWLVPALDDLRAERPERTIDLYFGESDALFDRLFAGRLDALVTSVRLHRPGLAYVPLHEEDYVFCASPAALARAPLSSDSHAVGHRLADTQPDLPLFRYFRDARPPDEVWVFDDVEHMGTIAAVRMRVLAGLAVAVLPRYFVAPHLSTGELVEVMSGSAMPTDRFRLIWRASSPLDGVLRALGETLRDRPLA